jgi:hypothetical protein
MGLFSFVFKLVLLALLIALTVWLVQNTKINLNLGAYVPELKWFLLILLLAILAVIILYLLVEYRLHWIPAASNSLQAVSNRLACFAQDYHDASTYAPYDKQARNWLITLWLLAILVVVLAVVCILLLM